jgi:hypothetical protein
LKLILTASATVALALAAASPAADRFRTSNLDSDPEPERLVVRELCQSADGELTPPQPRCGNDQFPRRRIEIEDVCNGQPASLLVSTVQDDVSKLRVLEADGRTARPEIFFDLRSGATGRGGDVRLVRLDEVTGACPRTLALFRYPSRSTRGAIPRGAAFRDSFSVSVGDRRKRYRGKEIRVTETYVDRDDAYCCPSFRRDTYFFFARRVDRYVRYGTRVRRIKAPGKRP